jgi:putative FmdB family regulatory protein
VRVVTVPAPLSSPPEMPIYEYRCENGHLFEVMQRISSDPVTHCEVCDAPVQRVFHPIAVHFKGSGFYNTDYGTAKRRREQEKSGDGGGGSKKEPAKGDAGSKGDSSSGGSSSSGGDGSSSSGSGSSSSGSGSSSSD